MCKIQRPCQFNNSTGTDSKFSVVARNVVVTVHQSRVPALSAFISTIGFVSIKSYTNCTTFQEDPPTMWAQLSFQASSKWTEHCWSTTPDINGCHMLRLFAHPVVCCCLLGVVVQSLRVSSERLCGGVATVVTKFGRTFRLINRWRQKLSTVAG